MSQPGLRESLESQSTELEKGALFLGPRGGKWANPQHTIPYQEDRERFTRRQIQQEIEQTYRKIRRRQPGQGEEVSLTHRELRHVLDHTRFALVSAGPNPNVEEDRKLTHDDLKARHEELRKRLVASGYAFTGVVGHYGGREDSFLVMIHDAERRDVRELGKAFHQDSVIYCDRQKTELHYTTGENADKNLCAHGRGWEKKPAAKDYYSTVQHPNGQKTKFSLRINFDNLVPCEKSITFGSLMKARKLHGRCTFQGMEVSIENKAGTYRKWYDVAEKREGKTKQLYDYGYIRGTLGTDGDHVDVYVGPNENAQYVYIVDQMKGPDFKRFDEQKCMLGFDSEADAKMAYMAHFDKAGFFGGMKKMSVVDFKAKVLDKENHGEMVKGMRPPAGYSPAPRSKQGGYRKKVKGEWIYWYPGETSEPSGSPKAAETGRDKGKGAKTPSEASQTPFRPIEGQRLRVFKDSRANKATNPGLWKMEHGHFHWKRSRTYEMARDQKAVRSTVLAPNIDDQTKMELISEFTPLIRKAARDAQRLFAIRPRYETTEWGTERNDTDAELQRAGIEGMLHAIRAYKGGKPFAPVAEGYVQMYTRLEAGRMGLGRGVSLPEMHVRNIRRFIAARVKAGIKNKTTNPSPEQIAEVFDLRLKHIHKRAGTVTRNELVPMEPYRLTFRDDGTGKIKVTANAEDANSLSRVEWARKYDEFLRGNATALGDPESQFFAEIQAGAGLATDDRIILDNEIKEAMKVVDRMGPLEIEVQAAGRPGPEGPVKTKVRIENTADMLRRRMGLGGHDEHSVHDLATAIPVYKQDRKGNWHQLEDRASRGYLQQFVEMGMSRLKQAAKYESPMTRGVLSRVESQIAPIERLPSGPTYFDKMKQLAASYSPAEVQDFYHQQVDKLTRVRVNAPQDRKDAIDRTLVHLHNMDHDALAAEKARLSDEGQKLSAAMHRAMTHFIEVERVDAHDGLAHIHDLGTNTRRTVRVKMNYDKDWEPTTPAGQPLLRKAFEDLPDSVLREIQRWPLTMALLAGDGDLTPERSHLMELAA